MKLTLMGANDSGHWFLCDEFANQWRIVEGYSDYAPAAQLLGWMPVGEGDEADRNALNFLMDNIGQDFNVPKHVADHFQEMQKDADE